MAIKIFLVAAIIAVAYCNLFEMYNRIEAPTATGNG